MTFRLRSGFGRCGTTPIRRRTRTGVGPDVGAADERRPRRRANARRENADRRRLAGAVGSEQAEELALVHREIESLERDDLGAGPGARRRRHGRTAGPADPRHRSRAAPLRRGGRGIDLAQGSGLDRGHCSKLSPGRPSPRISTASSPRVGCPLERAPGRADPCPSRRTECRAPSSRAPALPFSLLSKNCCMRIAMSFWFARLAGLCTSLL